jgi:hypothetical protein
MGTSHQYRPAPMANTRWGVSKTRASHELGFDGYMST